MADDERSRGKGPPDEAPPEEHPPDDTPGEGPKEPREQPKRRSFGSRWR